VVGKSQGLAQAGVLALLCALAQAPPLIWASVSTSLHGDRIEIRV
jgi:hypothetical protein